MTAAQTAEPSSNRSLLCWRRKSRAKYHTMNDITREALRYHLYWELFFRFFTVTLIFQPRAYHNASFPISDHMDLRAVYWYQRGEVGVCSRCYAGHGEEQERCEFDWSWIVAIAHDAGQRHRPRCWSLFLIGSILISSPTQRHEWCLAWSVASFCRSWFRSCRTSFAGHMLHSIKTAVKIAYKDCYCRERLSISLPACFLLS